MPGHGRFDIVIFGASGFTGQFVVEEVAKVLSKGDQEPFTWAVAGRSKDKVQRVLEEATRVTGYDVTTTPIVEADVNDAVLIHEMARQAKVLVNCVGPYRFWGQMVVEICIDEGTHHVDISGEPQFLEKVQLLYHKKAEEKGVYIVGACGYDSIPTDIGITYLKQNFKGELNSVEMFMELGKEAKKSTVNSGTWVSALHILAHIRELQPIRSKLFQAPLPDPKYPLNQQSIIHYSDVVKNWCIPFIGIDKAVVERSERYFFENEQKRPVQINTYSKQDSLIHAVLLVIGLLFIGVMSQFRFTRNLLIKYPRLFTLGFISNEGPTREQADFPFTVTLRGEGWEEVLAEPTDQHTDPPTKKMTVKVNGRNPGYGATCTCLIQSALTILRESDLMPSTGGVLTTAAAFSRTTIIPRLHENGLTFEVV